MKRSLLTVQMPDGSTRYLRYRLVMISTSDVTGDLERVAAFWNDALGKYPLDAEVSADEDGFSVAYHSPETDEEYQNRLAVEQMLEKNKKTEKQAQLDRLIQRRAHSLKPLTENEERALLASLLEKYPNA